MKEIQIRKVYNTVEELNQSEEFKVLWAGFQMRKEKDYPELKLVKTFVTDEGLYALRQVTRGKEKGLQLLGKLSVSACLNNTPFMMGIITDDSILINTTTRHNRDKESRKRLAELTGKFTDLFVCTGY